MELRVQTRILREFWKIKKFINRTSEIGIEEVNIPNGILKDSEILYFDTVFLNFFRKINCFICVYHNNRELKINLFSNKLFLNITKYQPTRQNF